MKPGVALWNTQHSCVICMRGSYGACMLLFYVAASLRFLSPSKVG